MSAKLTEADKLAIEARRKFTGASLDNAQAEIELLRIRDEALFIPIHHQIRPWAMKPGVDTIHRSNDYFEARYTTVK